MRNEHNLKIRTDTKNWGMGKNSGTLFFDPKQIKDSEMLSPLPSPRFFGSNGKHLICEKQRIKKYKPGRDLNTAQALDPRKYQLHPHCSQQTPTEVVTKLM